MIAARLTQSASGARAHARDARRRRARRRVTARGIRSTRSSAKLVHPRVGLSTRSVRASWSTPVRSNRSSLVRPSWSTWRSGQGPRSDCT